MIKENESLNSFESKNRHTSPCAVTTTK